MLKEEEGKVRANTQKAPKGTKGRTGAGRRLCTPMSLLFEAVLGQAGPGSESSGLFFLAA